MPLEYILLLFSTLIHSINKILQQNNYFGLQFCTVPVSEHYFSALLNSSLVVCLLLIPKVPGSNPETEGLWEEERSFKNVYSESKGPTGCSQIFQMLSDSTIAYSQSPPLSTFPTFCDQSDSGWAMPLCFWVKFCGWLAVGNPHSLIHLLCQGVSKTPFHLHGVTHVQAPAMRYLRVLSEKGVRLPSPVAICLNPLV